MLGLAVLPLLHRFTRKVRFGMMRNFVILGLTDTTAGAQSPAPAHPLNSSTLPK
jgi:hypothetical protein